MAQNILYIPAFSIEDVLLDKDTGAPMSGGIVTFFQDDQRSVMLPVWQITGSSGSYTYTYLPNPMTLSAIGTFVDALGNPVVPYFKITYDDAGAPIYYYITVTNSGLVPQFDREQVPYVTLNGSDMFSNSFVNELSNPQFAEVNFSQAASTYTYSFTAGNGQVKNIAPNWDIVVNCVGSASVTVGQVTPEGNVNIPTNPGTLLTITSSGCTQLLLRQRIYGSPNLWGNGNFAGTFVAQNNTGTIQTLTMEYDQSNGSLISPATIVTATLPADGAYYSYADVVNIPSSSSTDSFPNAYIDIFFNIPNTANIAITSVMANSTGEIAVEDIVYDQESQNRQIDHLFHYYQPMINYKPISSWLVGWDFPLNPAQANGSSTTLYAIGTPPTPAQCYVWDQTAGLSLVSNVTVTRNSVTGGLQAVTNAPNEAFQLVQYLDSADVKDMLNNYLSVNVNGFTTANNSATVQVFLYCCPSTGAIPPMNASPYLLGTVAANGNYTLSSASIGAGWTLIPRGNLGIAQAVLPIVNTGDYTTLLKVNDIGFSSWQITSGTNLADTDKFAIVVTVSAATSGTTVVLNSISCVPGQIPTRPAPQTYDEVLRECEHYYEKSFPTSVVPALTSSWPNALIFQMPTSGSSIQSTYFSFNFHEIKRKVPALAIYSAHTGTINTVAAITTIGTINSFINDASILPGATPIWNTTTFDSTSSLGTKGVVFNPVVQSFASSSSNRGAIAFNYIADARLGIVV